MKTKHFLIIFSFFLLSACSLSSEKAATTTASPQDISADIVNDNSSQISPTSTPDPLDSKDVSDQELLDILEALDSDLGIDSDLKDLDDQLN